MSEPKNNPKNTPVPNAGAEVAETGGFLPGKGKDGYRSDPISLAEPAAGGSNSQSGVTPGSDTGYPGVTPGYARISRSRLLELEKSLSDLDWQILEAIRRFRVVLGQQLRRLYFYSGKTPRANTTAVNRKLKSLTDAGLIAALNQRVNCRAKGFAAYIYYLTEAGERILQLHFNEPETRRRNLEPATTTLTHTLSIAECYVKTVELCRNTEDLKLVKAELEPDCWRPYQKALRNYILKPDMALVTDLHDTADHDEPWIECRWFIEIDLNTESLQMILDKCRRYYDYYQSDIEQRLHDDVFPLVVWIVKTEGRKQSLIKHLRETFRLLPPIFAVILSDEYEKLIRSELDYKGYLCPLN